MVSYLRTKIILRDIILDIKIKILMRCEDYFAKIQSCILLTDEEFPSYLVAMGVQAEAKRMGVTFDAEERCTGVAGQWVYDDFESLIKDKSFLPPVGYDNYFEK
jgi:hypothetical protein